MGLSVCTNILDENNEIGTLCEFECYAEMQ